MAVINAFYNTPERMEMLGLGGDYAKSCTDGIETEGKTVTLIGISSLAMRHSRVQNRFT